MGKQLGQRLSPILREVVKKFDATLGGEYSPDAESAAKRTLKNKALQMLSASGDSAVNKELLTRFREATNMTDPIAALAALIDSEGKPVTITAKLWEENSCFGLDILQDALQRKTYITSGGYWSACCIDSQSSL